MRTGGGQEEDRRRTLAGFGVQRVRSVICIHICLMGGT